MLPLIITASIGAELQRMAHDGAVVACPHHKFFGAGENLVIVVGVAIGIDVSE